MSWLRMINRRATEEEADKAVARLKPMIEAADASNQDGEDAVVNVIHAYDNFDGLVSALDSVRVLIDYLKVQMEYRDGTLDKINFEHVLQREPIVLAALAKAAGREPVSKELQELQSEYEVVAKAKAVSA